jgi:iron complex outermembrane receptor protein
MGRSRAIATLLAGTALALAAGSFAEAQPAPSQPSRTTLAQGPTIGEVLVTARRRTENLQDVPIAVTAVSQADLRSAQVTTARQLVQFAPSLNIGTGNQRDFQRFSIRGQVVTVGAAEPTTAYMDEAPYPQYGAGGPGFYFDMANVQVLNGPQGTLFGRNTTGGAVLFTPNRPVDRNGGWFRAGYGSYNNREATAVVNWAAVPGMLDVRLAGEIRKRDGYTKCFYPQDTGGSCTYDDMNYQVYRLGVVFKPTDWIENYLSVSYNKNKTNGTSFQLTHLNTGGLAGGGIFAFFFGVPQTTAYLNQQQQLGPRVTLDTAPHSWLAEDIRGVNTTTIRLSDHLTFKNIASYDREKIKQGFDGDGTPLPGLGWPIGPFQGSPSALGEEKTDYLTEEAQLQGKALGDKLVWVNGVFFEHYYPYEVPQGEDIGALGGVKRQLATLAGSTEAVFGQATLDLGVFTPVLDKLKLTGGVRYTWDSKHANSNWFSLVPPTGKCTSTGQSGFVPNCNIWIDAKWSAPTFTVNLDYKIRPNALLYVTASRGFNAGGINLGFVATEPSVIFGPEYVMNYEGGLKADFHLGDAPVRTDLAVFHIDYDHIQRAELFLPPGSLAPINPVNSYGSAVINGFELQAQTHVGHFDVSANYSYLDAHYVYASNDPAYITLVNKNFIFAGQQLPYAPNHKIAGTVTYHVPIPPSLGSLSLYGGANYQSSFRWGDRNAIGNILGDYAIANFGANWDNIGGHPLHLEFYITNAFDRTAVAGALAYYYLLGFVTDSYVEPRMVGFRLRYDFGGL